MSTHTANATSRVDAMVELARSRLGRLSPFEAYDAHAAGALLIDTRTVVQRLRQGELAGSIVIDRTVLEWRLDPTSGFCIPEVTDRPRVIVVCRQGYSSSLAAASLCNVGIDATDVVGGVENWIASGLPVDEGPADVRE